MQVSVPAAEEERQQTSMILDLKLLERPSQLTALNSALIKPHTLAPD